MALEVVNKAGELSKQPTDQPVLHLHLAAAVLVHAQLVQVCRAFLLVEVLALDRHDVRRWEVLCQNRHKLCHRRTVCRC